MNERQNDPQENGGLFPEDYEPPKRENPYLKKNRDKRRAEKNKAPKPLGDSSLNGQTTPATATGRREGSYTHKRTFSDWMFEHVKLISAIATVLVVLSLVLISDVVDLVSGSLTHFRQVEKKEITLTYVQGLSEKSEPLSWTDFEKFRHETDKGDNSLTWRLPVKDTGFEVWVTGVDTTRPPVAVWFIDVYYGGRITLQQDDLDAFLAEHIEK